MISWKNKLDIAMHVQISLHYALSVQYVVMVEENQLHYFNHTAITRHTITGAGYNKIQITPLLIARRQQDARYPSTHTHTHTLNKMSLLYWTYFSTNRHVSIVSFIVGYQ